MESIQTMPNTTRWSPFSFQKVSLVAPLGLAVVIALGSGTAALANQAKPGDILYPLDQWVELIEVKLISNPDTKAQLYAALSEERALELESIQAVEANQTSSEGKAKWRANKDRAELKVASSIERLNQVQALFEDKLAAETSERKQAVFRKVLDHLQAAENRRNERLDKIRERERGDTGSKASINAGSNEGHGSGLGSDNGSEDDRGDQSDDRDDDQEDESDDSNDWLEVSQEEKEDIFQQITQDFRPEKRRTENEREVDDELERSGIFPSANIEDLLK